MARIAVVGGGASGIGAAAQLLEAGLDVTIFEAESRLGGHCYPVAVTGPDDVRFEVDAGVSDFNETSFTEVRGMLEGLELTWHPVVRDSAFAYPDGRPVWSALAGERVRVARFRDWDRFVEEEERFRWECLEVLSDPRLAAWTAARWLSEGGYGAEFVERGFVPRAGGAFPMPDLPPARYLMRSIVAFWHMHGVLGPHPPTRMVLDRGMHAWPTAFGRSFIERGGRLWLSTRVLGVARRDGGVRLRVEHEDGRHETHRFDEVVLALSPNFIAGLLEDPSHEEWSALGGFHWQRARVCVHSDPTLLGADRSLWGSYNYLVDGEEPSFTRPTITFWSNRLASMPANLPDVFVTVNPHREPDPAKVHADRFWVHPCLERSRERSAERLDDLQGHGGIWYAGAWLRAPHVHEQALRTGLEIGRRIVEALSAPRASKKRLPTWDDTLRVAQAFVALDESVLEELRIETSLRQLEAGEVLFEEGEAADGMYVIASGRLEVRREGRSIATTASGDLVGELALLDRGTRTASLVALEPATAWYLPRERFEALCAKDRPAAAAVTDQVAREVCHRLRGLARDLGTRPPSKGPSERPPRFEPARVTSALARAVASETVTESVATFFAEWKDAGVFAPSTIVGFAGQQTQRAWLVLEGELSLRSPGGTHIAQVSEGHVAQATSLLDGGRLPVTVATETEVVAVGLTPSQFRDLRYRAGGAELVRLVYASLARLHRVLLARLDAERGKQALSSPADRSPPLA